MLMDMRFSTGPSTDAAITAQARMGAHHGQVYEYTRPRIVYPRPATLAWEFANIQAITHPNPPANVSKGNLTGQACYHIGIRGGSHED
jgi:hypothetical protein